MLEEKFPYSTREQQQSGNILMSKAIQPASVLSIKYSLVFILHSVNRVSLCCSVQNGAAHPHCQHIPPAQTRLCWGQRSRLSASAAVRGVSRSWPAAEECEDNRKKIAQSQRYCLPFIIWYNQTVIILIRAAIMIKLIIWDSHFSGQRIRLTFLAELLYCADCP